MENLIITRSENVSTDVRVSTLISNLKNYELCVVGRSSVKIIGADGACIDEIKINRLQRNLQAKKITSIIKGSKYKKIFAIDIDCIKVLASVETDAEKILDLHEDFLVVMGSNIIDIILAFYYNIIYYLYSRKINKIITISDVLGDKYKKYGNKVIVIYNINDKIKRIDGKKNEIINPKYVYHGILSKNRDSDFMIAEAAARKLDLTIYTESEINLEEMSSVKVKKYVQQVEITKELSQYDIGLFYYRASVDKSTRDCLPNKFFEFVYAGLPVIFGRNKSIDKILQKYKIGICIDSIEEIEMAERYIIELYNSGKYSYEREKFLIDYNFEKTKNQWQEVVK